jgi:hypothetical protein
MSLPALTPHRQCSRCAPCPGIGNCGCGCHYSSTVNHARDYLTVVTVDARTGTVTE